MRLPESVPGFFSKQLPILLLLLVIALGTFSRLARSGDVPLSMDESWRITCLLDAESLVHQMFAGMNRTDPPLFNLLIYLLGTLYNVEFMLRLVSIIPGILAIPLAYLVGRQLFSTRWLALLSSFLTAFNLDLLVYAKELKPFSLCAFIHLCVLYGYLKFRRKITTRTTIVFTALLVLSIPFSLNSAFAFPGVYLALFAFTLLRGTGKQKKLVLLSCVFLLVLSALCFFILVGSFSDGGHLGFMQGYWDDFFCPTGSLGETISWLAPRYLEYYTDLAFTNQLAPGFVGDRLHLIYPAMALLGFIVLLFKDRHRFFEAFCLFIMPMVVMAIFSMCHQWPFGQLRMNIFVVFYILFPPLFILDELGKISVISRKDRMAGKLLSSLAAAAPAVIVCALISIQFPSDFRTFSHGRPPGSWQASAPALEHLLDVYTAGPQIPLVCNHLGQSQLQYYSTYHRHLSARYGRQAHLFEPRGLLTRSSPFYLRGAMLRVCQQSRQAAIYLTHFSGAETRIYSNDFCIEHSCWEGISSFSCLITSEIFDAARNRRQVFSNQHFSGFSNEWEEVYRSPPLKIDGAQPGTLVVFNFNLDHHSANRKLRIDFLDQDDSAESFEEPSTEYGYPVQIDHLETAVCVKLITPVEQIRFSISARGTFDFTVRNLEYFESHVEYSTPLAEPYRLVEDPCERIQLERSIKNCTGFWGDNLAGFGWTRGSALIELQEMEIDPTDRVFMLQTYGWMTPEHRDDIVAGSLKIYLNRTRRAPLLKIDRGGAPTYYFRIPDDIHNIGSIRIKSNTYKPKEGGINDDQRALGIDVKSIGFPRILHEDAS